MDKHIHVMKYKDLKIETARKICRNHIIKDQCRNCPLRRTRKKNGKEYPLFCWYEIYKLYENWEEMKNQLDEEEIEHYGELENEIKQLESSNV